MTTDSVSTTSNTPSLELIVHNWLKKRGKLSQAETLLLFDKINHRCAPDYVSIQASWTGLYPLFNSIMTGTIDDVNKNLASDVPLELLITLTKFYNEVQEVKRSLKTGTIIAL